MYSKEKIFKTLGAIKAEAESIKPYVVVCQPRRDLKEKPAQNFDGYAGLHVDILGYSHGYGNVGGEKVDVARNILIDRAIESGAKYLFFVGEDTVIPYDGFLKLHATAEANPRAMVVGVYYIKRKRSGRIKGLYFSERVRKLFLGWQKSGAKILNARSGASS